MEPARKSPLFEALAEDAVLEPHNLRMALTADGACIVRGLLATEQMSAVLWDLASLLVPPGNSVSQRDASSSVEELSRRVCMLCTTDAERQSQIYEAMSNMPSLHGLASANNVLKVVRSLLSPTISIHGRKLLLMAPPEGTWHVPSWHQDWYYNAGPTSTLTMYAPLQKTDLTNGMLTLALGQYDLQPHGDYDIGRPCKWHHIDPSVATNFDRCITPTLFPGDVLFFHSLTPHAASVNGSESMRFVINIRYFDMDDPAFSRAGWRVGNLDHARSALSRRDSR